MAILCLANDLNDLKERLGRIVMAYSSKASLLQRGPRLTDGTATEDAVS